MRLQTDGCQVIAYRNGPHSRSVFFWKWSTLMFCSGFCGVGKEYYGPDGVYPFAGRECARALALQSTDTADCHDDFEGEPAIDESAIKMTRLRQYSQDTDILPSLPAERQCVAF